MLNDDCLGRTLDWFYAHDPDETVCRDRHAERGRSLASQPIRCMWTRPRFRSVEQLWRQTETAEAEAAGCITMAIREIIVQISNNGCVRHEVVAMSVSARELAMRPTVSPVVSYQDMRLW